MSVMSLTVYQTKNTMISKVDKVLENKHIQKSEVLSAFIADGLNASHGNPNICKRNDGLNCVTDNKDSNRQRNLPDIEKNI